MRPFLLILLAVQQTSGCRTAPSTECQKPPFVPGHNLVGEGFDIVRMKTTGAYVVNVKDYMKGGEHGNCTICTNKLLNQEQKLPAAVLDWRIKVRCRRSLQAKVFESSSDMLKEGTSTTTADWKVGLKLPVSNSLAVGGTHSKSTKFAKSHSSRDKFSYTSHKFFCSYYSFRLHSRPPLTKEFMGSVQALPAVYNSKSKTAYENFIATYGTHFLRLVDLGGYVRSTTAVRTCQVTMNGLSIQDVSNCLSAEAAVVIKGVPVKGQASYCKSKSNKLANKNSFSGSFTDRVTEVLGGEAGQGDLLFNPDKQDGYGTWLKTLKNIPGVVSYRLTSLHMLLNKDPVRKGNLQTAIQDYVMKNAIYVSCSAKCKFGHRVNCACKCSNHQRVSANCCPNKLGIAELNVIVVRAAGLWGDYFSKTDGYVKVFFGSQGYTTPVIWNNNFPMWNYRVPIGTVDLTERKQLRFEVWDRDNRWDDDLLGRVYMTPQRSSGQQRSFSLKHGSLFVSITATCGPSLTGQYCDKYAPSPDSVGMLTYQDLAKNHQPILLQGVYAARQNQTFL
ncbi:perforin-1.3 [Brachyhypopomus gauderio]|uniref:perforin-1.3 n=1 Tax=Brachyhypopomus gauderio TaxID=698409 RepID=UPI0040416482